MRLSPLWVSLSLAPLTAAATLFATLMPLDAMAVGPRTFNLDTLEKLSGGDLKGASVGSDGVVRPGWTLGNAALTDATAIFCALSLGDGSVLVGTSPNGRVFRIANDQASVFSETKELAVTSLVQDKAGAIYAATIPNGKIYKIAQGKADVFATLADVEHVWALALDRNRTTIFAATGPEGKVFRIEPNGQSSVFFDSEEPHIVSLAVGEQGELYAGSSGKAILYKVAGPGRASVLYDFAGDEVKSIAVAKGFVYAIANEYAEPPEPPKRPPSGRAAPGPSTAARAKPGKGSLYRFDALGRPERMMGHGEFHYLALALDDRGNPYVGTGAEGRVYTVNDAHAVTLVADIDERQVGALILGNRPAIVAGDPAVYHRVIAQGGADSVWTSKVLDAGLRARFGHLNWRASGALELSTRSGNSATPDATWSAWSAPLAAAGPITSPSGRFIQVRARWARDPKATLTDVNIPFVTDNVRAVVTEVTATQKGAARESKEGVVASGGEPSKHDTVVKVNWKVENPDSDTLRYRVGFRRDGQGPWRDMLRSDEVLTKTEYDWDTAALPEGKYRIRVESSDETVNVPEQVQKHALESSPVLVDNTPPVFQGLAIAGRTIRGRVRDGLGPIVRVELAVDGHLEWRPLGAADGIFDTEDEALNADVTALVPAGSHIVAVRAFDAAGNFVTQEMEAK